MENRKIFDQIAFISRGIFVIVMLLLAIALILHFTWRQFTSEPQSGLKENVQEIQEVTEDIQGTVNDLQSDPETNEAVVEDLSTVDVKLAEVNEQLAMLEDGLEMASVKETPSGHQIQGSINHIFTLVALFLGIFSIVTSVVLAFALNLRVTKRIPNL